MSTLDVLYEIKPQDTSFYEEAPPKPEGDREWIVFQGEIADLQYKGGNHPRRILSPLASKCHFVALYHPTSMTACCAHIDELTSIESTKNRFTVIFECKYDIRIDNPKQFKLKIFNGGIGSEKYLKETEEELREIFQEFEIEWINKSPSQLTFDCITGNLHFGIENEHVARYVEVAQRIEFNMFDRFYAPQDGRHIFGVGLYWFTEARVAKRDLQSIHDRSKDIPLKKLPLKTTLTTAEKVVRSLQIRILIDIPRVVVKDQKEAFSTVLSLCPDITPLKDPLKSQDYGLTLRRTAHQIVKTGDDKCMKLFKQLIRSASALKLDLTERGAKSGTVFNVIRTTKEHQEGAGKRLLDLMLTEMVKGT